MWLLREHTPTLESRCAGSLNAVSLGVCSVVGGVCDQGVGLALGCVDVQLPSHPGDRTQVGWGTPFAGCCPGPGASRGPTFLSLPLYLHTVVPWPCRPAQGDATGHSMPRGLAGALRALQGIAVSPCRHHLPAHLPVRASLLSIFEVPQGFCYSYCVCVFLHGFWGFEQICFPAS